MEKKIWALPALFIVMLCYQNCGEIRLSSGESVASSCEPIDPSELFIRDRFTSSDNLLLNLIREDHQTGESQVFEAYWKIKNENGQILSESPGLSPEHNFNFANVGDCQVLVSAEYSSCDADHSIEKIVQLHTCDIPTTTTTTSSTTTTTLSPTTTTLPSVETVDPRADGTVMGTMAEIPWMGVPRQLTLALGEEASIAFRSSTNLSLTIGDLNVSDAPPGNCDILSTISDHAFDFSPEPLGQGLCTSTGSTVGPGGIGFIYLPGTPALGRCRIERGRIYYWNIKNIGNMDAGSNACGIRWNTRNQ